MAQIIEETLTVKFSRLVKNKGTAATVLSDQMLLDIEETVQALVGDAAIVEIVKSKTLD